MPTEDQLGYSIPEALRPVFAARTEFNNVRQYLLRAVLGMQQLLERDAGSCADEMLVSQARVLADNWISGEPYAVCRECGGEGCQHCHSNGWTTEYVYNEING